ncbi:MAG: hypothetical protein ACKVT2_09595 [Saprospiraceae bacterium]
MDNFLNVKPPNWFWVLVFLLLAILLYFHIAHNYSDNKNANKPSLDAASHKPITPSSWDSYPQVVYASSPDNKDALIYKKIESGSIEGNTIHVPQDAALILLEQGKETVRFDDENGTWCRVKYFDTEGWIWGGLIREGIPVTKEWGKNKTEVKVNEATIYTQPKAHKDFESLLPKLAISTKVTIESVLKKEGFYYISFVSNSGRGKLSRGYIRIADVEPLKK